MLSFKVFGICCQISPKKVKPISTLILSTIHQHWVLQLVKTKSVCWEIFVAAVGRGDTEGLYIFLV